MDQERRLAKQRQYEGERMADVRVSVSACIHKYSMCSSTRLYLADPVLPTKEETDHSYHDVVRIALGEVGEGRACITVASHNPDSVQMAQMM